MKISHIPTRLATGAFIVNTGIGKLGADDDTAKMLHGMASGTYPMFSSLEPKTFVKGLGAGEIVVGGVLLAPVVPAWLAGLTLTGFAGGLLRMYFKTPGLTQPDGVRPSPQGTAIAKDSWLFGIGLSLLLDGLAERRGKRRKRQAVRRAESLRHHQERA